MKSADGVFCFVGNDIIFIRKIGVKADGRGDTDNGQKIKKNQFFLKSSRCFLFIIILSFAIPMLLYTKKITISMQNVHKI